MVDTAWVALSLTERIGGKTLRNLMTHFQHDSRAILAADEDALKAVPGVGMKIAQSIRAINLENIEKAISGWEQLGIRVMTQHDPHYPSLLRSLGDAPPTLFIRGEWDKRRLKNMAMVGRRNPSEAAHNLAQNLSMGLAEQGYRVISGLAYGIDYAAHLGALAVPEGGTWAVLGSGVLNIYPPEHVSLGKTIMQRGAIISELHPERTVSASNLVARNRIITGLSDEVIVVETEADGGAMYAARFALAQGRRLYVVDYPVSGNQALIEAGAQVIRPDLKDLPFG